MAGVILFFVAALPVTAVLLERPGPGTLAWQLPTAVLAFAVVVARWAAASVDLVGDRLVVRDWHARQEVPVADIVHVTVVPGTTFFLRRVAVVTGDGAVIEIKAYEGFRERTTTERAARLAAVLGRPGPTGP